MTGIHLHTNPVTAGISAMGSIVTGDEPIDGIDEFVETCRSMGLEECVAIRQASLDRYYER